MHMVIFGNIKVKIMINGNLKFKNETEYRETSMDSSSSLKDFSIDRKRYFKKYVLLETVEEKDTQAILMGKLVETLLWEAEKFDDKFYMSACVSAPTGLMLAFVEALYDATREATDEKGEVTKDFAELSREAYEKSGFKIKYEAVIAKFVGSDAEIYYNEIRTVRSQGLMVATPNDVANAEKIVEELNNNQFTRDIIGLVDSKRYTVRVQVQVEGFKIDKHLMKAMMDLVIVDHLERTLQVYDLKCVWAVENFYEEYYLYRRAYIQAFVYYGAGLYLVKTNEEYAGYRVLPPKFIVCDSTNYYNPLIYTLTEDDLNDAYEGFEYKGRQYPGVKSIIADLKWALEMNTWNIGRENYLSNGVVKLRK